MKNLFSFFNLLKCNNSLNKNMLIYISLVVRLRGSHALISKDKNWMYPTFCFLNWVHLLMNIISCTDGMCEFYEWFNLYYDFSTYECNCLGLGNHWLLAQIARSSWLPLLSLYTIFHFMFDVFLSEKNVELIINLIVLDKLKMVSILSHH